METSKFHWSCQRAWGRCKPGQNQEQKILPELQTENPWVSR